MAALRAENERMRRDNERFVRIIDSGEWGRGRVAELVQAGQVLQQEREQLRKLMGHLRSDYEAVERAKVAQAEELAAVKERMKKKGAANNRMLVKVRGHRGVSPILGSVFAHESKTMNVARNGAALRPQSAEM